MNRSFLKYIGCAFAVIAGVAVVDKVAGAGMNRLLDAVPVTQDIGKGRFAIREVETDVVIVGSSRAAHHYVSTMIADSLGCSVYNVGRDGCGYCDNVFIVNSILERYSPKIIILEVTNDYLLEGCRDGSESVYPYYYQYKYAKRTINGDVGGKAQIQMLSTLYRYNSISFRTIGYGMKGLLQEKTEDPLLGYTPLQYIHKQVPIELDKNTFLEFDDKISNRKYKQLKELLLLAESKDVKMVLVCSPYYQSSAQQVDNIKELSLLCKEAGAAYLNFSSDALFLQHPEWFKDWQHLNCVGASEYTKLFINKIKSFYENLHSHSFN